MRPEYVFLCVMGSTIFTAITVIVAFHFKDKKDKYKKFAELNDCPFSFTAGDGELVFDLDGYNLFSDYTFGVRKDGIYGIKELVLQGINTSYGDVRLKVGQSILPLIPKLEQFEKWTYTKPFDTFWKNSFKSTYEDIINKLDNFKIIEYENQKHKEQK